MNPSLTCPTQPPHLRVSLSENISQSDQTSPPEVYTLRAPASIAVDPIWRDVMFGEKSVNNLPVPGGYRASLGRSHGKLKHLTSLLDHLERPVLVKTQVHLLLLTEVIQFDSLAEVKL